MTEAVTMCKVLLAIHVLLCITPMTVYTHFICVKCNNSVVELPCDIELDCDRLDELVPNALDATVIKFHSGNTVLRNLVHFSWINRLTLLGSGGSTILCDGLTPGFQFSNVSNLLIKDLKFIGCGAIHNSTTQNIHHCNQCKDTVDLKSTLYFQDCINITLTSLHVNNGDGTGVAVYDTIGFVTFDNCTFDSNFIRSKHNTTLPGGSGVYIEFTYCPPGVPHSQCSSQFHSRKSNSAYTFVNCRFSRNNATTLYSDTTSYTASVGLNFQGMGRGGGLTVIFKGDASNNTFKIVNCEFFQNWATWGGGLYIMFQDNSSNNVVHINSSQITENTCYLHAGGGISIGFLLFQSSQLNHNRVILSNVSLSRNTATFGGGVVIYAGHSTLGDLCNEVEFHNCTWFGNSAYFGAAVDVTSDSWEVKTNTFLPTPLFKDCKFTSNLVINQPDDEDTNSLFFGKGTLQANGFLINFQGRQIFQNNNGSAIHLVSGIVKFKPKSSVSFFDNSGISGGAFSLVGVSCIKVSDDSEFVFINNTATAIGGAVYYLSIDNHDYLSSRSCFLHYSGSKNVTERNVTFLFEGNRAGTDNYRAGQSIFASSLIPCMRECNSLLDYHHNTSKQFSCVGSFKFLDEGKSDIATSGARFYNTSPLPVEAIPGKSTMLPIKFKDDLDQNVQTKCSITVESYYYNMSSFSFNKRYKTTIYGSPNTKAKVIIESIGFREVRYLLPVRLQNCPPGFVMDNSGMKCICSSYSKRKNYEGIDRCNYTEFRAYISRGYWAGYEEGQNETETSLMTGYCPFCLYKDKTLLPATASRDLFDNMCIENRTGVLCGQCRHNNSILFHNSRFQCYPTSNTCRYGTLYYFLSELIPVTLLFILVLFLDISFTSGALNGFILFAQLVGSMQINGAGLIHIPISSHYLTLGSGLIYKMFNLDFFSVYELSFCIWNGATSLDVLAVKYVTISYSLALVLLTILVVKCCASSTFCKNKVRSFSSKRSVIHGLSSFLVMCYAQCAYVSVVILTPGSIIKRSDIHSTHHYVVLYNGQVGYFHKSHLPYALPALFFLVSIVIIPPGLLILYPLCYKAFSILRINEKRITTLCKIIPLEKYKPFFDSFQGCFKDEHRYFAGLYFLYRLAIPVTFVTTRTTAFYVCVELELILMLTIHSLLHPYKEQWHNRLDTVFFFVLAVINGMTLWNYVFSTGRFTRNYQNIANTVSYFQAALMFIPLLYIFVYFLRYTTVKIKDHVRRVRRKNESQVEPLDLSFLDRRLLDHVM